MLLVMVWAVSYTHLAYFLSPFVSLACFNPAFRLLERIIVQIHLIFSRPFILGSPTLDVYKRQRLELASLAIKEN